MNKKLQARAFELVAPVLAGGEQPLAAARAIVGKFSSGRFSAIAKQAMVAEGMGALGSALLKHKKQFVVVTDRRVLFLPQTFLGGPGKTVLGEVSRPEASLAEVRMGVVSLVRIAFGDQGDGVALTFPRMDRNGAEALAAAMGGAPVS